MKHLKIKKSLNNRISNNILEQIEKSQLLEKDYNKNMLPYNNNIIIYLSKNKGNNIQKKKTLSFNLYLKKNNQKSQIYEINLREKLLNKGKINNDFKNPNCDNESFDNKLNKNNFFSPVNDYNLKKNIILPNITNKLKNSIPRGERNSENNLFLKGIHLDIPKIIDNDPNLNNEKNIKMKEYQKKILKSKSLISIRKVKTFN